MPKHQMAFLLKIMFIVNVFQKLAGSGGIRTHASERLVPKTSALDRSATLPRCLMLCQSIHSIVNKKYMMNISVAGQI